MPTALLHTITAVFLSAFTLLGCGETTSNSPEFDPEADVTIAGKLLKIDGSALTDTPIDVRNLRRNGFIDYEKAHADTLAQIAAFPILTLAWPFVWFYNYTDENLKKYEENPNFFVSQIKTSFDGAFRFVAKAKQLLRDADGGINITIVNGKEASLSFAKYSFVIKEQNTELGEGRLCDLGGVTATEEADSVTLNWQAPPFTNVRSVLKLADAETKSLIWSATPDAAATSITLPKSIFSSRPTQLAIEAFQKFETESTVSCITPPLAISLANPLTNLAAGAQVNADNISFRITSLTNTRFDDKPYFGAFDTTELSIDLGSVQDVSHLVLHNLQLTAASNLTIGLSTDNVNWTVPTAEAAKRFTLRSFDPAVPARFVRLRFDASIVTLQEVVVQ